MNPYDKYNFYDITATTHNTIKVDFDTYTFEKGDHIAFKISNPFYVDFSNAPDLKSIQITTQNNKCNLVYVPPDVVEWSSLTLRSQINNTTEFINYQHYPFNTSYHQDIIKDIYNRSINSMCTCVLDEYRNFSFIHQTRNSQSLLYNDVDLDYINRYQNNVNSNIIWFPLDYTYLNTFVYPHVNTIALYTKNENEYTINSMDITIMQTGKDVNNIHIPSGTYNFTSFVNIIKPCIYDNQHLTITNPNLNGYRLHAKNVSSNNGHLIFFKNEEFDKYFGVLHTINTNTDTDYYYKSNFICNMSPNFRTLHIDEGYYNPNDFVNIINNNKYDVTLPLKPYCFEAVSSGNDIFIQTVDNVFIFNKSIPLQTPDTDFSTTPTSSKKLLSVCPTSFQFNSTVNGINISGEYTPATFLRMIKDKTGCNFIINSNNIICSDVIECDNPYFVFTDELVNGGYKVINKCNLTRWHEIMIFSNTKYLLSDLNEYMSMTPSIIDYYDTLRNLNYYTVTGNEVCNVYRTRYLTSTNTYPINKVKNNRCNYYNYGGGRSFTGFINVKCNDTGTHYIQIYGYPSMEGDTRLLYTQEFEVPVVGEYDVCLNVPYILTSYWADDGRKGDGFIIVTGDVDCDFSNVIVESSNYNK